MKTRPNPTSSELLISAMILEQVTEQLAPFAVDARFTLRQLIAKLEDVLI